MLEPPPPDFELTRIRDEMDEFFIVKYPYTILIVTGLYIWFIKIYGPKMMAKRDPYDLTYVIRLYNLLQVFLNGYVVAKCCIIKPEIIRDYWVHHCHYFNTPDNPTFIQMTTLVYFILFTKVVDFLDSILMVFKKKYGQLTFLHVYHHAIVVVSTAFTLSQREGLGIAVLLLNAAVHVVMYAYYFLIGFKSCRPLVTWVKPTITKIQIIQFVFMLLYLGSAVFRNCSMGPLMTVVNPLIIASFLLLFIKFYIEAYLSNKKKINKEK